MAGIAALAFGCSSLKTYYSEYSALPYAGPAAEGQSSTRLPPVERREKRAETPAAGPQSTPSPAPSEYDREQAAAQAEAASQAALKASQEAERAAAEASRAAARAAGGTSTTTQSTPAPRTLSSSDTSDQAERQHAAGLIETLNRKMRAIDHQRLDADGRSRAELGDRFLENAQRAFAEGSYAEAASLADKAATMIAPLPSVPNPALR